MRITQTQEWVLAAVLIAYIAFTPGFQMVRSFLATPIGKAVGLAIIVYVWKYVSALVGLLLAINFVRCAGMREGMETEYTPIPDMPGKCKKMVDGQEMVMDCPASMLSSGTPPPAAPTGSTTSSVPPTAAPPSSTPPMTTPSPPPPPPPTNPAGFTNYAGVESFSPREEMTGSGGCSFSPI